MLSRNPWKRLGQKTVFKNSFLKVRVDNVVKPNGQVGTYAVTDSGHSNVIIPVTRDNLFYLVGQWRYPVGHYSWEFPGGKTEGRENSFETARRELLEETGFTATRIKLIGQLDLLSGMSANSYDILLAEDVKRMTDALDKNDGIQQIKSVTFRELVSMIGNDIKNAQSIAALMLYMSDPEAVKKYLVA